MRNIILLITFLTSNLIVSQTISEIEKANTLYKENNWQASAIAYKSLTLKNPTNGPYYYKLATSLRKQNDYEASINAYFQSLKVGYNEGRCIKFIAINYALINNQDKALDWIKRGLSTPKSLYFKDLETNKSFDNLRQLDAFVSLYPSRIPDANRVERWETDITFLNNAFKAIHYDLNRNISQVNWEQNIASLKENISTLSDDEIITKLMQLISLIGDGHTFVRPPLQGDLKFHFYPIQLYQFEEGIYVTAVNKAYKEIVGSQLTHIDGISINKVIDIFKTALSVDNLMGYKENIYLSMLSEVLNNLGITKNKTSADFTFRKSDDTSVTLNIKALDFNPAIWNSTLVNNKELPLYRSNPLKHFWYKHIKEKNTIYLQLNINYSMPDKDIEEFYNEVFNYMETEQVENLILDIRNCPGGNSFNNKPLLEHILKNNFINKKGKFYTIIGRKTFSAAMNLATDLDQRTNTIFIGEPTGSSPNFVGETNFVELPYSKINISISNAYWQRSVSWDNRKWIAPDIYIPPTFYSYKNNEDSVLDFILNDLSAD
ncbi:hypothetical protein MWU50_07560 [Flavobacteriaceae bacterium S0862]|nr:hypothetical protein [Flavobacteriaceae bacterium S0862]